MRTGPAVTSLFRNISRPRSRPRTPCRVQVTSRGRSPLRTRPAITSLITTISRPDNVSGHRVSSGSRSPPRTRPHQHPVLSRILFLKRRVVSRSRPFRVPIRGQDLRSRPYSAPPLEADRGLFLNVSFTPRICTGRIGNTGGAGLGFSFGFRVTSLA
jgi:hypothetical protein